MEDDLNKKIKKWKTTSKIKKKRTTASKNMEDDLNKKMEDEPINQNQTNWL
jgi:hypothetical protein